MAIRPGWRGCRLRRRDGLLRRAGHLAAGCRNAFQRRRRDGDWAGSGCFAGGAASLTFSPGSTSTAMVSFTFTPWVPSATRILPSMPSSTASTSMVALSVSISAMMSPDLTWSPSFFSQRASVPSVMVGESAGIRMLVAIDPAPYL